MDFFLARCKWGYLLNVLSHIRRPYKWGGGNRGYNYTYRYQEPKHICCSEFRICRGGVLHESFCPDQSFASQCWKASKGTFYTYLSCFYFVLELLGVHSSHDQTTMTTWLYQRMTPGWYDCDTMHASLSSFFRQSSKIFSAKTQEIWDALCSSISIPW